MKRLSILIAIVSCHKNRHRRDEVRKTWLQDVGKEFEYKFFVGNGKTDLEEDVVTLDVDDSYEKLPYKIKAICQYAVDMSYDYMLKVDDDTYIIPERMFHGVEGHDYVGRHNQTSATHAPKGFCSGLAYWLSTKGADILSWGNPDLIWEDQWAGGWLAKNGVTATHDKRYFILSMIAKPMWHNFVNQAACFAECRPGEMAIVHKMVHGWRPPVEETLPATGKNLRIVGTPTQNMAFPRSGSRLMGKDPNLVDPRTGRQFNRTGEVVRKQGRR